MRRQRSKTDYRIAGACGEWFAWRNYGFLQEWRPHVRQIAVVQAGRLLDVTAVRGRTPFEALERLRRIEAGTC